MSTMLNTKNYHKMKIYHNPRCTKSRIALKAITDRGIQVEIIEYLKNPITEDELANILDILNVDIQKIIRKNEKKFKESFKGKNLTEKEWIPVLCANPKLIQRPILISDNIASIARDEQELNSFLNNFEH